MEFDPVRIADPRGWLEARLAAIASFTAHDRPQNTLKQASTVDPMWPPPPCGEPPSADNGEINQTACCVPTGLPAGWIGTSDDQREWLAEAVPGGVPVP